MYQTGEKEVAVKVVAVAPAIILNSNTEILGMDPILEILAMEPTTTTKIMVRSQFKKSWPAAGAKKHY